MRRVKTFLNVTLAAPLLALLALAGCATVPATGPTSPPSAAGVVVQIAADAAGVPAPVVVANATTLDERVLLGIELAYRAARTGAELAVDAGAVPSTMAPGIASADRAAYAAVLAARQAYALGNAKSYAVLVDRALPATAAFASAVALLKR